MSARFVVDNSVVMGWCFESEGNRYAEAVLETLETGEALVPAIWPLEVGNVLLVAERKKRLSEAAVVRFLTLLNSLPITVEQETPERMFKEIVSLARAHELSPHAPHWVHGSPEPYMVQGPALSRKGRGSFRINQ